MSDKNYYDILGIKKDASVDEIKKAFRRQAVKHHPDQGGDEAKFKELNEAYEVLSNPEKRQRYDQFGSAGLGGKGGFSSAEGFSSGGFNFDFGEGGFGDIFSSIFGNTGRARNQARSVRDIEVVIDIDFKEAISGVEKEINLTLNDVCNTCGGQRAQPGTEVSTCRSCNGQGVRIQVSKTILGNFQQQTTCPECSGSGSTIETPCADCRGRGISQQSKKINIVIPAGIDDGQAIRLRAQGEKNRQGSAGDLYVIIQVKPHKKFTREGDLILSEQSINIVQAALGDKIKVDTIDDKLTLKIPPGTQSGTDFIINKKGVPHLGKDSRGNHIVSIHVEIPTKLNSKQKQLLKDLNLKK